MKAFMMVALCAGSLYADQSGDAFATGFANALRQSMERRQMEQQQYDRYQAQQAQEQELELLSEQVRIQREQLELQQRQNREKFWR